MGFVMDTYGSILLGVGRITRLGGSTIAIAGIIFAIFVVIWQLRKITRFKEKKLHMTKRINAVIVKRERKKMRNSRYRYLYTFSGLNEYEGVTFYDKSLLLKNIHVEGETVSLLINEYNLEEFWFEEEDEPGGKGVLIGSIVVFFSAVLQLAFMIREWHRLPWW